MRIPPAEKGSEPMREPERRISLRPLWQHEDCGIEASQEIRSQSHYATRKIELLHGIMGKIGAPDLQTKNYLSQTDTEVRPETMWPAPVPPVAMTTDNALAATRTQGPSQVQTPDPILAPSYAGGPWSWMIPTPPQVSNNSTPERPIIPTRTRTHQPRNKVRFKPYPDIIVNRPSYALPIPPEKRPPNDIVCLCTRNGGTPIQITRSNEKSPVLTPTEEINDSQPATSLEELDNFLDYDLSGMLENMTEEQLDWAMVRLIDYSS